MRVTCLLRMLCIYSWWKQIPFTSLLKTANKPEEWKKPSNRNITGRGSAFLIIWVKMLMLLQRPWSRILQHLSYCQEHSHLWEFQAAVINPTTSCGWEWVFSNLSSNLAENQCGVQQGQRFDCSSSWQNRTPTGSVFARLPIKVESALWMMLSAYHLNSKRLAFCL